MRQPVEGRSCANCTKCCEGTLKAVVHGFQMDYKKPCFLVEVGKGCKDYENRPNFCKEFQCEWLVNPDVPEHLAPNKTNVLISSHTTNGIPYLSLTEAGSKLDSEVLTWAIMYCMQNSHNVKWGVEDKTYYAGTQEFIDMMNSLTEEELKRQNK